MKKRTVILTGALAASLLGAYAAERGTNSLSRAQGRERRRPPEMPIMKALDANSDGVIDAKEIANASAALKTLDKNSDGKLTRDEIMPSRRQGQGRPRGRGDDDDRGQPPPPPDE